MTDSSSQSRPVTTADGADLRPGALLPDDLLSALRERAEGHDRENTFPEQDLEDLRRIGYLRLLVPQDMGGLGATVLETTRLQRRLAGAAPATALAVNMHLVVTGAALHAHRQGADSGAAILRDAADGHLFAFGISEPGNEAMLFDSFTTSARDGEDLLLHGTKIFTSLSPVWTRLVMHAALPLEETADAADGDARLVFGVLERGEGIEIANDWDTHGMRATQSATTRLDGARLPAGRILTTTPVGPNLDPFVFGIFGVFELLLAAVYTGIAERAVEVGTQIATTRRSRTRDIVHADDPDIRWRIADAAIRADGARLQIEKVAADLDRIGDADVPEPGPRWFLDFSGVKSRATESAIAAVDQVLRASGGSHYFRGSELERLSRDVRAGMYHPSDEESVHASYAKALLGELGSR